jgi:ATP-dependent DNA helicase RecG
MNRTELLEILNNGENSGVEFKRDDVRPESLAKEIAALANLEGGHILLGVEDDGTVIGLTRQTKEVEEWVANICRNNLQPSLIPFFEFIPWQGVKRIAVVTIPADCPDKPYKARKGGHWVTFVRVGSTSREATREEEQRLYQAAGVMRYDLKPVPGSSLRDLDMYRLANYFKDIRDQEHPPVGEDEGWQQLLINTEIMVENRGRAMVTAGGMLLFGINPNKYLPQAGVTATVYPGLEKDYATIEEEVIRGPLVSLLTNKGTISEPGVIDRVVEFVRRNMGVKAWLEGGRRIQKTSLPLEAVREVIVNATAHRDYTMTGTDIELSLYDDRLEVISPGRLPNTVTIEKMKQGCRVTRNELIKEVLRDYGYIEHRGMGIPYKVIRGMLAHNGTEPDLIEEESRFIVRLWKEKRER